MHSDNEIMMNIISPEALKYSKQDFNKKRLDILNRGMVDASKYIERVLKEYVKRLTKILDYPIDKFYTEVGPVRHITVTNVEDMYKYVLKKMKPVYPKLLKRLKSSLSEVIIVNYKFNTYIKTIKKNELKQNMRFKRSEVINNNINKLVKEINFFMENEIENFSLYIIIGAIHYHNKKLYSTKFREKVFFNTDLFSNNTKKLFINFMKLSYYKLNHIFMPGVKFKDLKPEIFIDYKLINISLLNDITLFKILHR